MQLNGYFSDGLSAERQEVLVMPSNEGLHIHDSEGTLLQSWPYKGLRLLEEVFEGQPLRLHHRERGDATLTLEHEQALAELERLSGLRLGGHPLMRPRWFIAAGAVALLIVVVAGLAVGVPRLAGPLSTLVPADWERALGERVIAGIAPEEKSCKGEAGTKALERLVARLTPSTEIPHPLTVRVADIPVTNAFTAPGGQIVILKGLINSAASPEEVAGVLAHEFAHSLERHPMQGLMRATGLQLLFAALTGDIGSLDTAAGQFGQMLVLFSFTRSDELDADRIGMALLNRAGIRGDGLLGFFERMQAKEAQGPGLPSLLSTHPLSEERMERIKRLATAKGAAMSAGDWAALQAICG